MRLSGPCVEAPDVPALVRFYERFLGWEVEELVGPRDDRPAGWGGPAPACGQGAGPQDRGAVAGALPAAGVAGRAVEASPQLTDRDLSRLRIMLDPAGHPFCLWT